MTRKVSIKYFLREDIGNGDITSELLLTDERIAGVITARERCVLAGIEEIKKIILMNKLKISFTRTDGERINKNTMVMKITGKAKTMFAIERTVLNILMKMSGIATITSKAIEKAKTINPKIKIYGTRKTTPGFRYYEKKAIKIGGGEPHRYGLYDMILIKDNHIHVVGNIKECLRRVKRSGIKPVEIEVKSIDEAIDAARYGADIIMLDNFSPADAKKTYRKIKEINNQIIVEVSGGVNLKNICEYAQCSDIISMGCLTHSYKSIDFSFDILEVL